MKTGFLTLLFLLLLASCTREAWQAVARSPAADSVLAADLPSARKYKFTAPVNIIIQRGNGNVATPTATTKVKADAAAIGPGSSAAVSKPASAAWWWFVLAFVAGGVGWELTRRRLPFLSLPRVSLPR